MFAYEQGIMQGTGDGTTFSPAMNLNRAMLMTILARMDGEDTDGGDTWYEFDMVPGEHEIRTCGPDVTGKVCVIGSQLKEHEVEELFHA